MRSLAMILAIVFTLPLLVLCGLVLVFRYEPTFSQIMGVLVLFLLGVVEGASSRDRLTTNSGWVPKVIVPKTILAITLGLPGVVICWLSVFRYEPTGPQVMAGLVLFTLGLISQCSALMDEGEAVDCQRQSPLF